MITEKNSESNQDKVRFIPDETRSDHKGITNVFYHSASKNTAVFIGQIIEKTNEQGETTFTALNKDLDPFLPVSNDLQPIVDYYKMNGCRIEAEEMKRFRRPNSRKQDGGIER